MKKVLVSACLLGEKVRYDGKSLLARSEIIQQWLNEGRVLSICPEVSAGMSIPRAPAEITGGDGDDVLTGRAPITDNIGRDVTESFVRGAYNALSVCKKNDVDVAVLTEFSPSCGSSSIYNGDFSGTKIAGSGVTAALLAKNGIRVFNQSQLTEANLWLRRDS